MKKQAKKIEAPKAQISFKRNFLPPLCGLFVMAMVFALFNAQLLIAQAQYHFAEPIHPITTAYAPKEVLDPNATPELIIPKINVKAPIVIDEPSYDEWKVQLALRRGVIHYGSSAVPGQKGNVVILGHSSGQPWAPGNYKFIFTLLDRLQPGDTFMITYKGTRYTYKVSDTQVVKPTDVGVASPSNNNAVATLITCTPVGTSKNRLVVHAKQITPNPAMLASNATTKPLTVVKLPANDTSTSLWQRLKELF